jgi:hypothetical protein
VDQLPQRLPETLFCSLKEYIDLFSVRNPPQEHFFEIFSLKKEENVRNFKFILHFDECFQSAQSRPICQSTEDCLIESSFPGFNP